MECRHIAATWRKCWALCWEIKPPSKVTQTNPFLNLFFWITDRHFALKKKIKKLNGKHKYSKAVLCVRAAASSRTSDRLNPVECLRAKVGENKDQQPTNLHQHKHVKSSLDGDTDYAISSPLCVCVCVCEIQGSGEKKNTIQSEKCWCNQRLGFNLTCNPLFMRFDAVHIPLQVDGAGRDGCSEIFSA